MAFNEIRRLKQFSTLSNSLSLDEISAFNRGAGRQIADTFIRREIRDYGLASNERVVFLTRDMVSALAENAEDLDVLYMAPKFPDQKSLDHMGIAEIREMIIEVATDLGVVVLKWDDGASFRIEGVWHGKNWFDYSRRRVRVTPIRET
ncbi:MAG: hypothetical protein ACETWE_06240 [Candidatus Bathyarchaeia archaeon]